MGFYRCYFVGLIFVILFYFCNDTTNDIVLITYTMNRMRNLKRTWIAALFLALVVNANGQTTILNVQQLGAKGQKDILVTKIIQNAINKCANAGGGTVYFPAGDYLMGHIELKSNVNLHIEAGATIWASRDTNDYKTDNAMKKSYEGGEAPSGDVPILIYANHLKNVSITGKGTINGRAQRVLEPLKLVDSFTKDETEKAQKAGVELKMYYKVPPFTNMIIFDACENVTVSDVSLIESQSWTLHLKWCSKVYVERLNIESSLESGVNADGIDVDGCKDVVIDNCIVKTGDDAIVLKTSRNPDGQTQNCENVIVSNCILTTWDSALKLGTESYSDFRHILITNCIIRNTNRAMSIIIRDGGNVSDVMFSNISVECNRKYYFWWGNGDPIWLVVRKRKPESKVGTIKNVSFQNIMGHVQGTLKLEGFEGQPLENITLTDVQLFMEAESQPDKRCLDAFYAHDVSDLNLRNVKVKWNIDKIEPLWRNAFTFENIQGLHLDQLQGSQAPTKTGSMIAITNVNGAIIENCRPGADNTTFLKVEGKQCKDIFVNNIYTKDLEKKIIKGEGVDATCMQIK
jgi:hypothetical protein